MEWTQQTAIFMRTSLITLISRSSIDRVRFPLSSILSETPSRNGSMKAVEPICKLLLEITATLTKAIGDNAPEITAAALKVGTSIATGVISGYKEFMAKNPVEAGIIAGILTPGTPLVKAAVAVATTSTAVQNNATKNLEDAGIMRTLVS
jgi:hypothetical protein